MENSIGEILRNAREEKGYDISYIAEQTKIQKRYLIALEEENYKELPGEVHIKGFLRNYCREVGLNSDEIIKIYNQSKSHTEEKEEEIEEKNGIINLIIVGIVIIFLGIIILNVIDKNEEKNIQEKDSVNIEKITEKEEKIEENNIKEEIINQNEINTVNENETIENSKEVIKENKIIEEKKVANEEKNDKINTYKEIKIIANGVSWIEIKKNNKQDFVGFLKNEEKIIRVKEDEKLYIKIGNAGAIKLIKDGESLGKIGNEGEVKKFNF
ncbi:MAG: hypothetical protein PWP46_270 [Fusobacteriaceae bacterium]|jgi:cytoskeletal protein RodZ|nr:helix-turn-helix protein [Fusobacteriales bacterium]MDN5303391.1 hypothetical protein [Fusobacteriaceae bacterium]